MDLLTLLFRLPLLPLQAFIRLGEILEEETDRQLHDPARIRRELEEAEQQHAAGEISDEDLTRIQQDIVARMGGGVNPVGGR